jgi:hypothetical protein
VQLLRSYPSGKAAGVDSVPPDFFSKAYVETPNDAGGLDRTYVLAPTLATLFEQVRLSAAIPASWRVGKLVPVYKRGDAVQPGNYRPLVVSPALYSLYSKLMQMRLQAFVEPYLPDTMYGFRPRRNVLLCHFILATLMQSVHARVTPPFYVAAMDLQAAYDTVDRGLLWQQLHDMGCSQHFVSILQNIYSSTQYALSVDGHMCPPFNSTVGLKQGCPLSPVLFNVFVHTLPATLQQRAPDSGVCLPHQPSHKIQILLYADDILLVSHTHAALQALIDALDSATQQLGLTLNPDKCEVFHVGPSQLHSPFTCRGVALPVLPEVKYLGLMFKRTFEPLHMQQGRIAKARLSVPGLLAMLQRNGMTAHPRMVTLFYKCLYLPVLTFGCEIWGPAAVLRHTRDSVCNPLQAAANLFLKQAFHLPQSCPNWPLLSFLNVEPIHYFVLQRVASFWNELQLAASPLLNQAVHAQQYLHGLGKHCWLSHVNTALRDLHPASSTALLQQCPLQPIEVPPLLRACRAAYQQQQAPFFQHNVHDPTCPHRKISRYYQWFHSAGVCGRLDACPAPLSRVIRIDVTNFVLGSCLLAVNPQQPGVPFADRACCLCGMPGAVMDEFHVLFHCPQLDLLRSEYEQTCLSGFDPDVSLDDCGAAVSTMFASPDGFHFVHDIMSVLKAQFRE